MYYRLSGRRILKRYINARNIVIVGVIAVLICIMISVYGKLVSDKAITLSDVAAEAIINEAVNTSVEEYMNDSADSERLFLLPLSDASGRIIAYTLNTEEVATAEKHISDMIASELKQNSTVKVKIPSGSLTDIEFFSGKGFPVTFKSHLSVSVKTSAESSVESVGINHTLYSAKLNIYISGELMISGKSEEIAMEFQKVLAERIIIGDVPLT